MIRHAYAILLMLAMLLSGCRSAGNAPAQIQKYTGPVEPLDVVVSRFNQNSRQIQTLWAAGTYEANLVDAKGKKIFVNGDATLLFGRDAKFRLFLNKVGNRLFDAGSDGSRFWLVGYEGVDTAWVGSIAGFAVREQNDIPVRPDMLLEVLGLSLVPVDLLNGPIITQRFNPDQDVYMLTFASVDAKRKDRYVVSREVWLDRKTFLPTWVFLHDADGQVMLRARLSGHVPISKDAGAGKVARVFDILVPQSGSKLVLKLSDVRPRRGVVPSAASFAFSPERAAVGTVIDLDLPSHAPTPTD